MMENVLLMAIVTGLWYWFSAGLAGYTLFRMLKSPTFIGFCLGLLWGDVTTGLIAGGSIEVIYLGLVAPGGNIPSDKALAALIAIPLVLMSDMSIELAISIAVPVGILGVFINNIRRYSNSFFVHLADRYAIEDNSKGIWRAATWYPMALGFVIRFPIVFVANLYGADLINNLLEIIPDWFLHGMSVMGGLLPALGFATTIFMIGKREFMPLFFVGFFLIQYFDITIMGAAIFGLAIALVITYMGGFPRLNAEARGSGETSKTPTPNLEQKKRTNEDAINSMMREVD